MKMKFIHVKFKTKVTLLILTVSCVYATTVTPSSSSLVCFSCAVASMWSCISTNCLLKIGFLPAATTKESSPAWFLSFTPFRLRSIRNCATPEKDYFYLFLTSSEMLYFGSLFIVGLYLNLYWLWKSLDCYQKLRQIMNLKKMKKLADQKSRKT